MKFHNIAFIGAVAFLLAVFPYGGAEAKPGKPGGPPNPQDVVDDYCDDVDRAVRHVVEELGDASIDLAACSTDFDKCMHGHGIFDKPSTCIHDYSRCIKFGKQDQKQACIQFLLEWGNDTRRAEKDADEILPLFRDWLHGDTSRVDDPTSDECLGPAFFISNVCMDQQIGDL